MRYRIYTLQWRGLTIEARYCANNHNVIAHLEIETIDPPRAPLPVTETGYRSHFHPMGVIERDYGGDVVAAVKNWLDAFANTPEWKEQEVAARQGKLFESWFFLSNKIGINA